ncbi:HlyD family secretion protein [Modicisalibacter ilicicola DSM 19980]|uniref:HlyD family secretion protein n=1 Tax=Modicisalibacter ilicicola DSM 19980 TaxID=1121942 RepID=A0A1M5AWA7_9GAMM|nr:HlyD family efflux transporter periplasmic adaptor subunit [Halomonas ilicicola]SHF34367.1 HlyD family secretion protein [Halomonas ilicicola DSM 19980]
MNKLASRKLIVRLLIAIALVGLAALLAWQMLKPQGLPEGFSSGNGRIEATEIDVATKLPGRLMEVLVDEGAFVEPGQVIARMNTDALEAELAQAKAQVRQAENALITARSVVVQRESEHATAKAVVLQRQAELDAADKRYRRSATLVQRDAISRQQLDDDRAARQSAEAALAAARSQVLSAEAGVESARSQAVEAESAIEAAKAAVRRVQADIDDSELRADRLARVQYRIAQPGEVLGSGAKILNLVDLTDVYMTFFLPTRDVGRVALGEPAHIVLDAAPQYVIPARVSYVASVAQFTPKTVETESEREKLMFRVRARLDPELLMQHVEQVKTGLPGVAYLKLDDEATWPDELQINVKS